MAISKQFNRKHLFNVSSLDIIWFSLTTPELLLSLTLNKFIMKFFQSFYIGGLLNFLQEYQTNLCDIA